MPSVAEVPQFGGIPPRSLEQLLESTPQERAIQVQLAQEFKGVTLVGCREPVIPEQNPLSELSQNEYSALLMIAEGRSNGTIAFKLGYSPTTIPKWLPSIYSKLGVQNRVEAASFIPIEDERLMYLPPTGLTDRDKPTGVLTKQEHAYFDLLGSGVNIARIKDVAQFDSIANKLGLVEGFHARSIMLRRSAGALRNLGIYANALAVTALEVQTEVTDILDELTVTDQNSEKVSSIVNIVYSRIKERDRIGRLTLNFDLPYQRIAWEIVYREAELVVEATESS